MNKTHVGLTGQKFTDQEVMPWQYLSPPYFWAEYGEAVIADRHLPDGTRQHLVAGTVPQGLVVRNAQVFGSDDTPAGR